MKTAVLCGITLLAAAAGFAQTTPAASADSPRKTITLTGCVGGGTESKPITLSDALIVPGTAQPGQIDQTPSLLPPPVSSSATEPDATVPPPTAAPTAGVPPSPTGTSGTKATASTSPSSGVVTGTAPAGSSGSTLTGYRLSGMDMQPWIGKRVQVIGTFVPAAPPATAPPAAATGAITPPVLEFRVQTILPATGTCSHQ